MKKLFFSSFILIVLLSSCGKHSSAYKKLEAKYDSLMQVQLMTSGELNDMLSIIDEVENNFESIREAEDYLTIRQKNGELGATTREEIRRKMTMMGETLKKNRVDLAKLQEQLKRSGMHNSSLQKTVNRLNKELEEKTTNLIQIQNELAKHKIVIQELDSVVGELSKNVEDLTSTNINQSQTISKQDKEINTVYYCFGTAKELKEQKIIAGGGIFGGKEVLPKGFNQNYFIAIDKREVTEIPTYAPKAKLLTKHPEGSYEFVKDSDKKMTIKILDANNFWSVSKYLVIQVTM